MRQTVRFLLLLAVLASIIATFATSFHLLMITVTVVFITLALLFPVNPIGNKSVIKISQTGILLWQSPIPYFVIISLAVMYFAI